MIKTRFCPSPTGLLHLGNLRTALFALLFARKQNGHFLLRIEDTDRERSEERYTDLLQEDLHWLGMPWDEGPGCEQNAGPYWQSQRQSIYDEYYIHLEKNGSAYPCFCSEEQLALARKIQRASNKPPRYPGTCRRFTAAEIAEKQAAGLKATLRFAVPQDKHIDFTDLVKGDQHFENNDMGDFIIRRTDGTSPFMYCNAIDDALMGVTHVLRGEDHITNTPRQILILQALGLRIPEYGHISLITGEDGAPLSKRNGSQSAQDLRAQGYLPEAVINYLARLGHRYEEDGWMSFDTLASKFLLSALGVSPARFDPHQLLHWQHEALARCDNQKLWEWMGEEVHHLVPTEKQALFLQTIKPNITFPKDALHWAKVLFEGKLTHNDENRAILDKAGQVYFDVLLKTILASGPNYAAVTAALTKELGVKGKDLFAPLRVVLTGELKGPELVNIFALLGKEGLIKAIDNG
jgi:glutamyl-tRNA synthetase